MSFFEVGSKFGVNQANLMKKLGCGDDSTGGVNEVRLFNDDNIYVLKAWNGSTWETIGTVDKLKFSGTDKVIALNDQVKIEDVLNVTGPAYFDDYIAIDGSTSYGYIAFRTTSGKNGATLGTGNGNDALKLNMQDVNLLYIAGGDVSIDEGSIKANGAYGFIHDNQNPDKKYRIETGEFHRGGASSGDINITRSFQTAFASTPRIVLQDWLTYSWSKNVIPRSRTTTGFTFEYDGSKNQDVDWIAIGEV